MFLYNLTLGRPSGIQSAIYGAFSEPDSKLHEIVVSRGKVLELLRPDESGRMQTIYSSDVFGVIRVLMPFKLPGDKQDHVIIGSDAGRVVILKFDKSRGVFKKVHQETFGKSGCRRIVPGQYLATDPAGRACMVAAVEKQKFVYILNRDSAANLTISSPLEAHKSHNVVFSMTGIDMGFDNPVFAAIELDYGDVDQDPTGEAAAEAQKNLVLYELDLGLNHVKRKSAEPIDNGANLLIPLTPHAAGGVLVCAENFIFYKKEGFERNIQAVIPRRNTLNEDRGVLITAWSVHKPKAGFFFLLQASYGDIYKVTLSTSPGNKADVTDLEIKYFDTIAPCTSICVLRSGFLFAASEFSNHALYQFQSTGEEDPVLSRASELQQSEEGFAPVFFNPRPLTCLVLIDEMESLMPVTHMEVANLLNEEIPQIYAACGRGPRSSLKVLRPGLAVTEMAVSPLPGNPTAVWTIKRHIGDDFDAYIIVSFTNATLVLSIGETVEEVSDSGFLATSPTLRTQLLVDDSMLQIHPQGLRHIAPGRRVNEWRAPGRKVITHAASNERQVVIALSGGEIIYFEMEFTTNQLMEVEKKDLSGDVACMDLGQVPTGRQRSRFLAVGSHDQTVRILSLDPDESMKALGLQAVQAQPDSLLLLDTAGTEEGSCPCSKLTPWLHFAGLNNGVLLRTQVDRTTGAMSDTRTRFLGTKPPKLFGANVKGQRAMLALSKRPWLGYSDMGRYNLTPLSYETLDFASGFASDQCPEGFVAVAKNTLRILTLERLGEPFNQQLCRLRYTPRKFVIHQEHKVLVIIESDAASVPWQERLDQQQEVKKEDGTVQMTSAEGPEQDDTRAEQEAQYGYPKADPTKWASCVRVVDPITLATASVLELDNNEAAISMCLVRFAGQTGANSPMLAVGTVKGLGFYPRAAEVPPADGYVRLYRFVDNGRRLEMVHITSVAGIPGAMAGFKGRLLVGVNSILRLYDLGKKKLLRKAEYRRLPTHISALSVMGDRIYVGDAQESLFYMKYKKAENQLYIYADDSTSRHISCTLQLDYDTVCGADKFGNIFIARLPSEISAQIEDDPTGGKYAAVSSILNGAPHKLENIIQFHVGDMVTSLQRAVMQPGGQESIIYGTVMGGIGALLPLTSREDTDFFSHLEMHLRQENPPLAGRDHMAYRSYYFPVKDVLDGDLCEQYTQITPDKQKAIAEELDRNPGEVLKKLEDVRNRIL
eukprot:jgi/Astpho2/4111/e_gw1.00063.10.1_t